MCVACIAVLPHGVRTELILEDAFESGSMDLWRPEGGGTIEVSDVRSRAGDRSLHFLHTNYRCEVTANSGLGVFDWGTEYWVGLSIYLVDWDSASSGWNTLVQTHTVPGNQDWDNCVSGDNGCTVHANRTALTFHAQEVPDPNATPTTGAIGPTAWETVRESNRWYDWVFHFRFSPDSDGFIEAWVDGEQVADITGANVHRVDCCGIDREPWCYLKPRTG
jgi:hypothetical protein